MIYSALFGAPMRLSIACECAVSFVLTKAIFTIAIEAMNGDYFATCFPNRSVFPLATLISTSRLSLRTQISRTFLWVTWLSVLLKCNCLDIRFECVSSHVADPEGSLLNCTRMFTFAVLWMTRFDNTTCWTRPLCEACDAPMASQQVHHRNSDRLCC